MELRVLGPVQVLDAGVPLPLGGAKQRAVLVILALHADRVVSTDALIEGLWGQAPPESATNMVQAYVSRLRKVLNRPDGGLRLEHHPPGYILTVEPAAMDLVRFEKMTRRAAIEASADPAAAATRLREALTLWRGEPLAEFPSEPFTQFERPRLGERRLAAAIALMDAELTSGRHAEVIGELTEWAARYPLNERLPAQLMLALYRSGRQAEALAAFQRTRRTLTDELGVEPGPALRELEASVLAHRPHLDWTPPTLTDRGTPATAVSQPSGESAAGGPMPIPAPPQPLSDDAANSSGERWPVQITPPKAWDIPARSVVFTGRDDLLTRLHSALCTGGRAAVYAVHGIGGIGKTTAATEYAHRYADHYDIAWWVPAENPALVPDRLAALGRALALASDTDTADTAVARLFGDLRDRDRSLLIFDNAEDPSVLTRFLPPGPGHILITSRNPDWHGTAVPIPVEQFLRHESITVLHRRLPGLPEDDADRIAAALGDLPLAVDQAAALLADTGLAADTYLQLLDQRAHDVLTHRPAGSMATSWAVAVDRLAADEPAALQLLTLAAWLAPEPIPMSMITDHPDQLPAPLDRIAGDPLTAARLTRHLRRRGMATIQPGVLSLHRVPAALLRAASGNQHLETGDWPTTVLRLLRRAVPDDPSNTPAWPVWRALLPHVLTVIDPDRVTTSAVVEVVDLLRLTGEYLMSRGGDPRAALPLLERAYHLNLGRLDPNDPDIAETANLLAAILNVLGEHERAGQLTKEIWVRHQRTLGPDHLWTLRAATHYAVHLRSLHQHEQARSINQDAYTRASRTLGANDPLTLALANGLAINLSAVGRREQARELDQDTLERSRRLLGEDHPDTLASSHNLANDLRGLGMFKQARELDQDTFNRKSRVLGEDHPDTLGSVSNLAMDLHEQGEHEQARQLNEDILRRCQRLLGEDHPQTLRVAHNLAGNLRALGDYQRALEIDEDTLACRQRTLRPDHPGTLNSTHNLATDHAALGHHELARHLDQQTLTRRRGTLGDTHPATQASAHNLALDHAALNRGDESDHHRRKPTPGLDPEAAITARRDVESANDLSAFR